MRPTELSEQEEVDENELPGHEGLMSDPVVINSECSDEESRIKERPHVGYSLKGVWKFYEVKVLDSFYGIADRVKRDHSIKCRFNRCKYETTDSKRNTTTTNMRGHLFSFHNLSKDDVDGSKTFDQITSICCKSDILNQIQKSNVKSRKTRTEEALLDLFGDGSLPFSLIENMKFQKLFEINDIALPLKSRATLSRKLRDRGDEIEKRIKALLSSKECLSLHLALDLWQSPSKRHSLSVIGSYVDEGFQKKEVLLAFSHFNEMHTGENLAHAVFSLLAEFGVTGKLTGITSDGASTI
jgi:hypothetical protein